MKSSSAAQIIEGVSYMDVAKMSLFSHCWCDRILHRWHSLWLQTGIHYRGHQRGHPNNATSQDKDKDPLHSFPPQPIWFGLAPLAEISKCTTVTLSLKVALLRVSWTQTHLIIVTLFQILTWLKILTESSDSAAYEEGNQSKTCWHTGSFFRF